uniref:Uncharacterized protein n=1 Tax=Gibberella zeae TaxID=5518 RepID=A0A4E9EJB0_GIBZA
MVNAKAETEGILTVQAVEVTPVELRDGDNNWRLLGQDNTKSLLVACPPWHIDTDPALAAPPVWLSKEPRAIEMGEFAHKVFERDPEDRVSTESMFEFLLYLGCPLLGAVAPGAFPDALPRMGPRIAKL